MTSRGEDKDPYSQIGVTSTLAVLFVDTTLSRLDAPDASVVVFDPVGVALVGVVAVVVVVVVGGAAAGSTMVGVSCAVGTATSSNEALCVTTVWWGRM